MVFNVFQTFSIKDMKVDARCADDHESVLTPNKSQLNDGVAPRAGNGLEAQTGHFRKVTAEALMVSNGY